MSAGSLITGHEKGSIVVWHGLTQFYLSAVSQAVRTRKTAAAALVSGAIEEGSKSGKKHKKDKVNFCVACTTGTQSIVLVLLVSILPVDVKVFTSVCALFTVQKEHKKKHEVLEYTAPQPPLCTTLHWHAHAGTIILFFRRSGSYSRDSCAF
jgi:hypothetical protein